MGKSDRPLKKRIPVQEDSSADHSEELTRLRRVRGQIEGVERMIEQGRYCIDIVNQMRSIAAAVRSAESLMLERHIRHCVKASIHANDSERAERNILELLEIFQKR